MRVIGIDPGYGRMGVAVVEKRDGKEICLYSTCIETKKTTEGADRLYEIGSALQVLVRKWDPDYMALETLFVNKSKTTALAVAEARGMAIYIARNVRCNVVEYSPQAVKIAVTGYGKSEKRQIEAMVKRLVLGIRPKALDDEYDAIAVAVTALASLRS